MKKSDMNEELQLIVFEKLYKFEGLLYRMECAARLYQLSVFVTA